MTDDMNPLPSIRKVLGEALGFDFSSLPRDSTSLSFVFSHLIAEHADALCLPLVFTAQWRGEKQTLVIEMAQETMIFAPWDADAMHAFFTELTEALAPYIGHHSPDWAPLMAGINTASFEGDHTRQMPVYYGSVDCDGRSEQEVLEMAISHFAAAVDAMVFCQTVFKKLVRGQHSPDVHSLIDEMVLEQDRQQQAFSPQGTLSVQLH